MDGLQICIIEEKKKKNSLGVLGDKDNEHQCE